jgi:competence protein ComEC
MLFTPVPDVLVARDGRQVAIAGSGGRLLVLREGTDGKRNYALDSLREAAAVATVPLAIEKAPGARCSADFCALDIERGGRRWVLLVARSKHYVDALQLIRACAAADIVISSRTMPRSCAPRWLKADRRFLAEQGGLAISLGEEPQLVTVADSQGRHGWWRPPDPYTVGTPSSPGDRRSVAGPPGAERLRES